MSDYRKVSDALKSGAEPALLCATCPWDRFCVTPPSITSEEIEAATNKAKADDVTAMEKAKAEGKEPGMPVGALLTVLTMSGRDTSASCCPVLALRLRSSEGDRIVKGIKAEMTSWDDEAVKS